MVTANPTRRRAAAACFTARAMAGAAGHAVAQDASDAAAFDTAMLACERNHWPQAWAALARLADRAHPHAALGLRW